jgi:hypothetical protein
MRVHVRAYATPNSPLIYQIYAAGIGTIPYECGIEYLRLRIP